MYTTRWQEKRRQYIGFLNTNLILAASFVKRTKEKERISYEVCWPFAGGEHSWNKWEEMKKRRREWGWEGKIANRKKWKIIMTSSNEKLGSAGDWCFTTWVLVSCQYSRISSLLAVTEPSATTPSFFSPAVNFPRNQVPGPPFYLSNSLGTNLHSFK